MITLSESIDKRSRSKSKYTKRERILRVGYTCEFIKRKGTRSSVLKIHFSPTFGSKLLSHPIQSLQRWLQPISLTIRQHYMRNKR